MINDNHPRNRRIAYYQNRNGNAWSKGFCIGFISACIIVAVFLYGQQNAYGNERPSPHAMSSKHTKLDTAGFPPHYRTWLRIGMCEQPKRGISWHDIKTDKQRVQSIAWKQTYNYSFPGGMGMTRLNWDTFKPRSAKHIALMSDATVAQQLWAAENIWRWAERTYPTNGHTAWECSFTIGWTTADPDDALR